MAEWFKALAWNASWVHALAGSNPVLSARNKSPEVFWGFLNYTMWCVYVIRSIKDGFIYRGMSENVEERVKTHNRGKVKSTKFHRPFDLIYKEKVGSREAARKREKYLKSAAGRKFIKKIISNRDKGSLPD